MNTKKIIIFSVITLIVVGAGVGYFLSKKGEQQASAPVEQIEQTRKADQIGQTEQRPQTDQGSSVQAPPVPVADGQLSAGAESSKPQDQIQEVIKAFVTYVVVHTDSGYVPPTLSIKKGDNVTFKNISKKGMWTASAQHPAHKEYPTAGGCIGSTFDSCKSIMSGDEWSFTFDKIGTWKYHNHVNTGHVGSVTVE